MSESYEEFVRHVTTDGTIPLIPSHTTVLLHTLHNVPIQPEGHMIEMGVFNGGTISAIANTYPGRRVFGFDSFEGLPETWTRADGGFERGAFNRGGHLPSVPGNVALVKGWFSDTLPQWLHEHGNGQQIAFLHVDCDLYSSTKQTFDLVGHLIKKGTVIVFDELINYPGYEHHELKALWEAVQKWGWKIRWLACKHQALLAPTHDFGAEYQSVAILIE